MASNDSKFKPAEVHPKNPEPAPSGSGAAQEQSYEVGKSRPQFTKLRLNQVKQMVEGSNPGEVGNVAEGWKLVRIKLVGGGNDWNSQDWNDGIKKKFDDAVTKVLETWHGSSADQFADAAQKISNNFAKLAAYPHNTGYVLHQISERLAAVKKAVEGVEEPSEWERIKDRAADGMGSGAGKGAAIGNTLMPGGGGALVGGLVGGMVGGDGRDDSQLNADLANPKMSIFDAVNKNRGSLSIDRERELEAAHYMEQLATTYRAGVTAIGKPPISGSGGGRIDDNVPDRDGGDVPIPPIGPYGPTPSGPKGGTTPNIPGMKGGGYTTPQPMEPPRPHGIDGGVGSVPKAPAPHIGTGLDGLQGGTGPGIGGGGGGGVGGGVGTGGLGAGSGSVGGGSGPGVGGSGAPGMVGGIGGAGGARAGGAGAGTGARGGRAGMPGMGGAAGGAKGAGAKGAGGKGSPLARQKGGVVGGKGGKLGAGGQGGSGLHRSRGGTQQGASGGRRPAGMAGAHGAHGAKGKDKGGENGQRPDYLVEEEETWTPERNVAPKVIE
ncbi:WXG100 family type VII secretion target [Streptomyces sioyaensis]|uniref:WXG100 family type VII secretion target n=1 Tax=Streptomyces sioyaensis TaxID=67364 RepID=UPI00366368D1